VLYFFEEGCPRCREKWPAILAAAKQSQSKPVMLIAVNSGTSPDNVAQYVRREGISVPVIVDFDRSLERLAGVNEVSLKNIWQARMIGPDGDLRITDGGDIPAALEAAAERASWNVDPAGMPSNVIPTWRQVEFGNYASAAKMLTRIKNDRNPETKAAGEKLYAYVEQKLIAAVEAAVSEEESWKAYLLYKEVENRFAGFELPKSVDEALSRLQMDEEVKNQISAMRQWQIAERSISSGRVSKPRLAAIMNKIIEKYPDTEAARLAQETLDH
jgi:thiol-disulfide isomerase/thioredoxin